MLQDRFMKAQHIAIIIIVISILILGFNKINSNKKVEDKSPASVVISVDDDGFTPSEITIPVGTTVTFKNIGTVGHWPASDAHPIHTIYPEFDPNIDIEPGAEWSFVFDKVGNWKFHDHSSSSRRGFVNVINTDGSSVVGLAENSTFDSKCLENGTDFSCYEEYYNKLTVEKGITASFDDLKKRYAENAYVRSQCHPLTHVLGNKAVVLYPKVSEAFNHGDSFCWSGYYHGVMEGIVGNIGKDKVIDQLNSICSDIAGKAEYSFGYYNCVHGLGHGLMAISDNELFKSLDICNTLNGEWEKTSCYGGAFMENVIADGKGHVTNFLKPSEPLYPCSAVVDTYKGSCYLMQTSYMLKVTNNNFSKVFALCRTADKGYENICFQSLGRDASGQSLSNAEKTKATCDLGADYNEKSNCIVGAVKDFISYYHSDKEAKNLCSILSLELNKICTNTAVSYYKSF